MKCSVCGEDAHLFGFGGWICRECFMLLTEKQKEMKNISRRDAKKKIAKLFLCAFARK